MTTALAVLIWLACAWIAAMFGATGVAICRMRRDRKEKP